jgi:CRP-like cAMP-binding protein
LIAVENIYAGRIFEVGEIEEGTFFGEIGFFTDHTSTASLIAHTDCAVWSISKEEFTGFLDANPVSSRAILYYFLGIISNRLRQVYREADEQTDEQGGAH